MSFDLLLKARFVISYMKMIPKTIKNQTADQERGQGQTILVCNQGREPAREGGN